MIFNQLIWGLAALLISLCLSTPPVSAAPQLELMDAAQLKLDLGSPGLVVIDARSRLSYRKGHIKGAINLDAGCGGDLVSELDGLPCKLRPEKELSVILHDAGICPERRIVIYGDRNSWGAEGRLYWLLQKFGFNNLALLDGGFDYWQQRQGPTTIFFADQVDACPADKPQLHLTDEHPATLNDKYFFQLYRQGKVVFLDVRSRQEFDGAVLYKEKRGGHLPGARHLNWEDFKEKDQRLAAPEQIRQKLQAAGLPAAAEAGEILVVPYCTGGIRSGYAWFVLKLLGYPRVENYDNGFWEWAAAPDLPVERGRP